MAFLRLLTNKTVMGSQALAPSAAWRSATEFLALPEVELLAEPIGLDGKWALFASGDRSSPNLWTDANLAAYARSPGRSSPASFHRTSRRRRLPRRPARGVSTATI